MILNLLTGLNLQAAIKEMETIDGRTVGAKVINASVAGLLGVTSVFPMDLTKTRLQNQQPGPNGELMYKGIRDCFIKTRAKENGIRGMYKGATPNLLLITPEKVIKMVGNDIFRTLLRDENKKLSIFRECLAGACTGMCQIIITTPMEFLKIQGQDAGRSATLDQKLSSDGKVHAKSTLSTIKEVGLRGVYKGFWATALRDVTFSAIYFPLAANLASYLNNKTFMKGHDNCCNFAAGLIAGGTASLSVNPFDVVKTRLQTISKGKGEVTYKGIADCFVSVYKNEGIKAFYKGGLCRILVIAPLFGIVQGVYYFEIGENLLTFFLD